MKSSTHHVAPIADGGIDDGSHEDSHKDSDEETEEGIMKKRASLWRAILSSLGKTFYPYSRYIRTLNLQDLEKLLFSLCPAVTITARISKHQK